MADIRQPTPAKLIAGMLAGRTEWLDSAAEGLVDRFGPTELVSPDMVFDFTDYYRSQMGPGLIRRFLAFQRPIDPGRLGGIKHDTIALEGELARRFPAVDRPVNIDPGYVQPAKLVLASTKDFSHRIYLGNGIHAEVTLQYRHGKWESLPWTFPDYRTGLYDGFLSAVRDRLKQRSADERPTD